LEKPEGLRSYVKRELFFTMNQNLNPKTFLHLMPVEKKLWLTFLREYGDTLTDIVYDVHVGQGRPAPEHYPPNIQAMALQISQYRIDAVARVSGVLWIYEVKPYAGTNAIGQLMCYEKLYRETFQFTDPIKKGVITNVLRPDIKALAMSFDITVYVVEPAT